MIGILSDEVLIQASLSPRMRVTLGKIAARPPEVTLSEIHPRFRVPGETVRKPRKEKLQSRGPLELRPRADEKDPTAVTKILLRGLRGNSSLLVGKSGAGQRPWNAKAFCSLDANS
ncbi:uncharacterized protein LOC143369399 [Andrena cerasifolii]|uniref:uncharacterized protein LOC143369399 n=1 Tax=Andrena cerasifolii TaxID=2819439 RepID=UPI00403788C4